MQKMNCHDWAILHLFIFIIDIDFFGFYFAGDFNARLSQKFFPLTRLFYDKSFFSQN